MCSRCSRPTWPPTTSSSPSSPGPAPPEGARRSVSMLVGCAFRRRPPKSRAFPELSDTHHAVQKAGPPGGISGVYQPADVLGPESMDGRRGAVVVVACHCWAENAEQVEGHDG